MTPPKMHLLNRHQALRFVRDRRDLFDGAERSNPFAGAAWTLHFIEQVASDSWTFVIPESFEGGRSLMLLYIDRDKESCRVSAVTNYYASLYSPLISALEAPAARRVALAGLIGQLLEMRPRSCVMNFSPLAGDCSDTVDLRQLLADSGWYAKQYDCFGNWYLPCANTSFADYMNTRDSKLRNTWSRKRKKFGNSPGGARLEIVVDPGEVSRAMDAYDGVYEKSWKKPEPYATFVRDWAHVCARNGSLRLGLAWLGDRPIAAQFWFVMHDRAYIFKLAYDEEYSNLSAGTVLSAHMFKHALDEDRVVEIDYLTGDDAYKQSWMTERRQRVGIIACNPRTPRGLMIGARELAGDLRHRLRRIRQARVAPLSE